MACTSARVRRPEPEPEEDRRRRVVRFCGRVDAREIQRARRSRSPCTRAISRSVNVQRPSTLRPISPARANSCARGAEVQTAGGLVGREMAATRFRGISSP